ncbi:MAG: HAD family phosphatase [Bacteroidota bacterium]
MSLIIQDRKIQGIIFDMDGTMIDNMMIHHRAWQQKLAEYGLDLSLDEVKERIHGVNEEILEREFGDRFTPEQRRQIASEKEATYRAIYRPELQLITGLPEFLDRLDEKGIPFGIGTAAPGENANFVLEELKLRDRFKTMIHAGHVTKGKPDPEVFEKAANAMQLPLQNCIVFEDSPTGAEAASRGGALSVIITTTHRAKEFAHLTNIIQFIDNYANLDII